MVKRKFYSSSTPGSPDAGEAVELSDGRVRVLMCLKEEGSLEVIDNSWHKAEQTILCMGLVEDKI